MTTRHEAAAREIAREFCIYTKQADSTQEKLESLIQAGFEKHYRELEDAARMARDALKDLTERFQLVSGQYQADSSLPASDYYDHMQALDALDKAMGTSK